MARSLRGHIPKFILAGTPSVMHRTQLERLRCRMHRVMSDQRDSGSSVLRIIHNNSGILPADHGTVS
jgi:hypothetical protein